MTDDALEIAWSEQVQVDPDNEDAVIIRGEYVNGERFEAYTVEAMDYLRKE